MRDKMVMPLLPQQDTGGYGVAAVLRNGSGPVVMLRADFDALPIEEKTGLEYASKKRVKDAEGTDTSGSCLGS